MDIADLYQRFNKSIQLGTVAEVQANPLRYKVRFDDVRNSYWLRHGFVRMGTSSTWDPYSLGEQVLCIMPSGNSQGVVVCAVDCDINQPKETELNKVRRDMPDGAIVEYDYTTKHLNASLPLGGKITVIAPSGTTVVGPLHVSEDITCDGDISDKVRSMAGDRDIYNSHMHGSSPTPDKGQ